MDKLPPELLALILQKNVNMCCCDKNLILDLRLVCKAFDRFLKTSIFKTIQLEFSRFSRFRNIDRDANQINTLRAVGPLATALYIDMMIVRDPDEIERLKEVFDSIMAHVPEMAELIESLRKYCLSESTFIEEDYKKLIEKVLENGPEITRLKVNLPFQVVGTGSMTATRLFANTLACAANRPDEYKKIDTLVLDHVSDRAINNICNVPIDVENAFKTFENLKSLVISIKRQEQRPSGQNLFTKNLWLMLRKAEYLQSLCIIGWNVSRNTKRRHSTRVPFGEWAMRSLPYHSTQLNTGFRCLRYLELKRIDIDPTMLWTMMKENCHSLTELYLNEVYLKVFGTANREHTALWIGYPNVATPRPEKCTWIAPALRNIENLNLKVLRVSGLGYDDYNPDPQSLHPNYDLDDPTGRHRSFDLRFVEAVLGTKLPIAPGWDEITFTPARPDNGATFAEYFGTGTPLESYDAESYQLRRNTTSHTKRCIDGVFFNHNEEALRELHKIITVADRGMHLISQEIDRSNGLTVDHTSGRLVNPSVPDSTGS